MAESKKEDEYSLRKELMVEVPTGCAVYPKDF